MYGSGMRCVVVCVALPAAWGTGEWCKCGILCLCVCACGDGGERERERERERESVCVCVPLQIGIHARLALANLSRHSPLLPLIPMSSLTHTDPLPAQLPSSLF